MTDFDDLLARVRQCTAEQKQTLFREIRQSVVIHDLESRFGVSAEVILEAISRATDLTQRGVRGVIAETVFVRDVIPTLPDWHDHPPVGDLSYDACLTREAHHVRIQVKMQRREKGAPKMQRGSYVVEVQRTRTGKKAGVATRPYRFSEFDMLAVCMQASTGSWHSFMYAMTCDLIPDARDPSIIRTFQPIPPHAATVNESWTDALSTALERFVSRNKQFDNSSMRTGR